MLFVRDMPLMDRMHRLLGNLAELRLSSPPDVSSLYLLRSFVCQVANSIGGKGDQSTL